MLAETVDDFVLLLRSRLDDKVTAGASEADKLWTNAELIGYTNVACDALAQITRHLRRTVTLTVSANNPDVALPSYVLEIDEIRLVSTGKRLIEDNELTRFDDSGFIVSRDGAPEYYATDKGTGYITLDRTPLTDDALNVVCSITLREPLEEGDDMPFTAIADQNILLKKAMAEAYGKQDAETFNQRKADRLEAEFIAMANDREVQARRHRRQAGTIRMEW